MNTQEISQAAAKMGIRFTSGDAVFIENVSERVFKRFIMMDREIADEEDLMMLAGKFFVEEYRALQAEQNIVIDRYFSDDNYRRNVQDKLFNEFLESLKTHPRPYGA